MICTKLSHMVIVTRCDLGRVLVAGPRAPNDTSLFAGAIVTIKSYKNGGYHIAEAPDADFWTDDMFVGLANENECYCESLL